MILAIDTSTAACSAALFDGDGTCLAHRDEMIGRGHSERLVPMLDEMLDGRRADAILVGVGPGSFTGIRVGIAAAQGLAIAWDCELKGMSSLALLAAGAEADGDVAAAVDGGPWRAVRAAVRRPHARTVERAAQPSAVRGRREHRRRTGRGARRETPWSKRAAAAGPPPAGRARRTRCGFPNALRSFPPKPVYARAPDARARNAA